MSEWQAYERLEPFGEWRQDFRIAQLCALIGNVVRQLYGKKGSHKTVDPVDFMLQERIEDMYDKVLDIKRPKQSVEEMKRVLEGIAKMVKSKKRKVRNPITRKKAIDG